MDILFKTTASSIEVGDQILVDEDPIEVTAVLDSDDIDEVIVMGYSHESGDTERYSLYADDEFDVWAV